MAVYHRSRAAAETSDAEMPLRPRHGGESSSMLSRQERPQSVQVLAADDVSTGDVPGQSKDGAVGTLPWAYGRMSRSR